jgi:hypothetical protein
MQHGTYSVHFYGAGDVRVCAFCIEIILRPRLMLSISFPRLYYLLSASAGALEFVVLCIVDHSYDLWIGNVW